FFFTNFPEDVKSADLWPRFARFGRVGEVFIPAKVDKQGKRFGFVKFRDVRDAKELLRSLSDIWFGSFRLRINISKFSRRSDNTQPEEAKKGLLEDHHRRSIDTGKQAYDGRSFKSALLVGDDSGVAVVKSGGAEPVSAVVKEVPEVVWEVEVEEERLMNLEGAYVGYLVEDKDAHSLQNNFRMSGFHNLRVCVLGHMAVLFWSDKVDEVKEMVETVGWWCSLFEKLGSGV
ncbi:RNA recognition motif, partial [Trifolium medium]|nr:RNA recognition motif [Trifolium medium]